MPQTPLVTAEWLESRLRDPRVRIVDCRFNLMDVNAGKRAYATGHIPGALYLDLERDLSGPKQPGGTGGRHPLPDPEELASRLGRAGIGNEHVVVAYDEPPAGGMYAARLWWLLRWLGHEGVHVLDGGLSAWLEAGGHVETRVPAYPSASFTARARMELVTDAAGVQARGEGVALVDSRARARYAGETEPIDPKAGHIPGALNVDWAEALGADGRFRTPAEQAARFRDLEGQEAIVYCGSGVSASVNLLALELAGRPLGQGVRLYAGSWSDWVSDPGRAVATGNQP